MQDCPCAHCDAGRRRGEISFFALPKPVLVLTPNRSQTFWLWYVAPPPAERVLLVHDGAAREYAGYAQAVRAAVALRGVLGTTRQLSDLERRTHAYLPSGASWSLDAYLAQRPTDAAIFVSEAPPLGSPGASCSAHAPYTSCKSSSTSLRPTKQSRHLKSEHAAGTRPKSEHAGGTLPESEKWDRDTVLALIDSGARPKLECVTRIWYPREGWLPFAECVFEGHDAVELPVTAVIHDYPTFFESI